MCLRSLPVFVFFQKSLLFDNDLSDRITHPANLLNAEPKSYKSILFMSLFIFLLKFCFPDKWDHKDPDICDKISATVDGGS